MKFSIITCTYNSERFLLRNIDSVLGQTLSDFEHLFVDGFSSDNTVEIIKQYQKKYPDKVKLIQAKPAGIANAMNVGIKNASGDYIIHLHSDDSFFDNDVLKKVAQTIGQTQVPWLYGKAKFIDEESQNFRVVPHRRIYQKARFWLLCLTNYIPHQAVFLSRSIFNQFGGFDESLKSAMDYDYWLKLSRAGVKSHFIDSVICNFSVRLDAQSASIKGKQEDYKLVARYVKNPLVRSILLKVQQVNHKRSIFPESTNNH